MKRKKVLNIFLKIFRDRFLCNFSWNKKKELQVLLKIKFKVLQVEFTSFTRFKFTESWKWWSVEDEATTIINVYVIGITINHNILTSSSVRQILRDVTKTS